jgi:hypothetical protein
MAVGAASDDFEEPQQTADRVLLWCCSPQFVYVYSPKTPQKWTHNFCPVIKPLISLALPTDERG